MHKQKHTQQSRELIKIRTKEAMARPEIKAKLHLRSLGKDRGAYKHSQTYLNKIKRRKEVIERLNKSYGWRD